MRRIQRYVLLASREREARFKGSMQRIQNTTSRPWSHHENLTSAVGAASMAIIQRGRAPQRGTRTRILTVVASSGPLVLTNPLRVLEGVF